MFKVLIFDSDSFTARALVSLSSESSENIVPKYCQTLNDAIEYTEDNQVDLFVVNVGMEKNDDGLSFARAIKQSPKYGFAFIVFLTRAEDEEMKRALHEEFYFCQCIDMPMNSTIEQKFKESLALPSKYRISQMGEGTMTMLRDKQEIIIKHSDILWVNVKGKNTILHMIDGTKDEYLQSKYSLDILKPMLGDGFIQIFRSHVVNKMYVKEVNVEEYWLKLEGVEQRLKIGGYFAYNVGMCLGDKTHGRGAE